MSKYHRSTCKSLVAITHYAFTGLSALKLTTDEYVDAIWLERERVLADCNKHRREQYLSRKPYVGYDEYY